ncbi:polyphosphate kinase [Solibacillus sp. FSL R5-0691]|uniref:polyphosphate kinase n=1 Tax=unclassified Solibacillus TaxID=2637870 RepID=UPI0030D037B2
MDKHLKELNFEEKIKTSFTEDNKRMIMNEIHKVEQNRITKPHYFQNILTVVLTVGVLFFGFIYVNNHEGTNEIAGDTNQTENHLGKNQNNEGSLAVSDNDKEQENEKKVLEVGRKFTFWDPERFYKYDYKTETYTYYDFSDSNYNLYAAHLKAAVITDNAIYMSPNELEPSIYVQYLESIIYLLENIEHGEDKEKNEEFKKAAQLAKLALKQGVSNWEPTLEELHEVLHELDEHYNTNPFKDGITGSNGIRLLADPEE